MSTGGKVALSLVGLTALTSAFVALADEIRENRKDINKNRDLIGDLDKTIEQVRLTLIRLEAAGRANRDSIDNIESHMRRMKRMIISNALNHAEFALLHIDLENKVVIAQGANTFFASEGWKKYDAKYHGARSVGAPADKARREARAVLADFFRSKGIGTH